MWRALLRRPKRDFGVCRVCQTELTRSSLQARGLCLACLDFEYYADLEKKRMEREEKFRIRHAYFGEPHSSYWKF